MVQYFINYSFALRLETISIILTLRDNLLDTIYEVRYVPTAAIKYVHHLIDVPKS